GRADANLKFSVTPGQTPGALPSIDTTFQLHWKFDTNDGNGSPPTVSFGDVTVSAGSLFGTFLAPFVQDIQQITAPIQPFINILKTPIPGISDLSHLIGGGDVTLESLALKIGGFTKDPELEGIMQLASLIIDLTNDIDTLNVNGDKLSLDFGGFDL